MNTAQVAKILGVSPSTIQRWVKQLDLPMERNERGHYLFHEEDIQLLKNIQEQLQNGVLIQEIQPPTEKKKPRKGLIKSPENDQTLEKLIAKVKELELNLNTKADSVTSYQLLQHRSEIEELQSQVKELSIQVENLQSALSDLKKKQQLDKPLVKDHGLIKRKKKNFVSSLFGF
ncbi:MULTISPECIES: MerR family transcriptional regulator [Neobacillus]|jgi:chromosome-anchoring protein RacA|uniref:MerR family transcriptional regulator n=1 Tax=Neobacillus TaxID=2675232 RepID=UPI0013D59B32|nr:MerR family transcriptional regulator [Neobacillus sedimentimangrovi]